VKSSIGVPQFGNELVHTVDHLALASKHCLAKLPLLAVQRIPERNPPPKRLQTLQAARPAISVPALIVEAPAGSTSPCTIPSVEHAAAAIAGWAEKLGSRVLPVQKFIVRERDPLVTVDDDPVIHRFDLHRQPVAGPA
jgi:hypothetical protein